MTRTHDGGDSGLSLNLKKDNISFEDKLLSLTFKIQTYRHKQFHDLSTTKLFAHFCDFDIFLAECRESAQLLIALVHLPLLVFGLPYILWCVSCLRRVVAFWVKPGVLVVVVANSDTNLRMCNNISNASLVHYNYWCAYYPDTCHGHSSIRITLDTRHGHTNLALQLFKCINSSNKSNEKETLYKLYNCLITGLRNE
ncbi:hypothetical protein AGLY_004004 [Aphis glycines]|uniref:Uncharacterized protein n=1 Tax=Aphis glycines TaxID=307491 RepID=A0A6G0TWU0_APHGL|nr:hypothetical protein AGLY_004004 [Aphis glycines]